MNVHATSPDWTTLEHLVLDFGGVLYRIDHQATAQAFAELGADGFLEQYAHGAQSALLDDLECGQISDGAFLAQLQGQCHITTSIDEVRAAWQAVLLDLRPDTIPVLQDLAAHYDLVLFSNTNALHAAHFERQILDAHGRAFSDNFRQIVYSHRLGLRKPDVAAYKAVAAQFQLKAKRTFFVDDTPANVEGAHQAGWFAGLHDPHQDTLKGWLQAMGCPIWD